MAVTTQPPTIEGIYYPESDGKPMAENTEQYDWIVAIKENLDALLTNAFVAADLFWYPVEGNAKIVQAPDVMVALGRPKGQRGSYKQWQEANIAPQVIFEILSPGNRVNEMLHKFDFYQHYQVQEYYVYDPEAKDLFGYIRQEKHLTSIEEIANWISPLLGIRFEQQPGAPLAIYFPDGKRFLTVPELRNALDSERQRAQRLADKLRELGIDPDSI
jgi:Uma2 family endonuclease